MPAPAVILACSHSALQLARGARLEGLRVIGVADAARAEFYRRLLDAGLLDELVVVDGWSRLRDPSFWESVAARTPGPHVVVPHGSLVEYVGPEAFARIPLRVAGSRRLVEWEADPERKMRLLEEAGIPTPRRYRVGEEPSGLVIVKLRGAKGGRGYFLARSGEEVVKGVRRLIEAGLARSERDFIVQEYVVGVPVYVHCFASRVRGRIELLGFDVRWESNADALRRLPPEHAEGLQVSYTVVANTPMVVRESLAPKLLHYCESFAAAAERLVGEKIVGPYSIEGVVTPTLEFKAFEFSGRIVAGTNAYMVWGSQYLATMHWMEGVDAGRRLAAEIREAWERGILDEVTT